jgi:hypothetical protein
MQARQRDGLAQRGRGFGHHEQIGRPANAKRGVASQGLISPDRIRSQGSRQGFRQAF